MSYRTLRSFVVLCLCLSSTTVFSNTLLPLQNAAQSPTTYGGIASRAIDGNTNGNYSQGSVTHTASRAEAKWSAELAQNAYINEIQVWNRTDCCRTRLRDFYVFVSDQPIDPNDDVFALENDSNVSAYFTSGTISGDSITIPVNRTGQYIRVQLGGSGTLSLAEVQVRGSVNSGLQQLPLTAALQSSTYLTASASRAIDGNTSGNYYDQTVSHSLTEVEPWWTASLVQSAFITEIEIWNRTDCCRTRLRDFYVFVSDQPIDRNADVFALENDPNVYNVYTAGSLSGDRIVIPINRSAQHIRVQLGVTGTLALAEVVVRGAADNNNGTLLSLQSAMQSSTYPGAVADRAIDGNTNGDYFAQLSVSHTYSQTQPWWSAAIAQTSFVTEVQLWNRTDCCQTRLRDFYVFVSEQPITRERTLQDLQNDPNVTGIYTAGTLSGNNITIPVNRNARYIRVQLAGYGTLALAEVQIRGTAGDTVNTDPFTRDEFYSSYVGSFRLTDSNDELYAGRGFALSPDGNYFYTTKQINTDNLPYGSEAGDANANPVVARYAIPSLSDITPSASVTAQYVDEVNTYNLFENSDTEEGGTPRFAFDQGGLIEDLKFVGNKLVGTFDWGYDSRAVDSASRSHFTIGNPLNLSAVTDADVQGLFNVAQNLSLMGLTGTDGTDAGYVAGYMAAIPPEYQSSFQGLSHITAEAGGSIISRTNVGPAAYAFNAASLSAVQPLIHRAREDEQSNDGPNMLRWREYEPDFVERDMPDYAAFNNTTTVDGVFFVPGRQQVVFVGSGAAVSQDVDGYQLGTAITHYGDFGANDIHRGSDRGTHSQGGNYEFQMWVHSISDLTRGFDGQSENTPDPVEFRFDFGYDTNNGIKYIGGVDMDWDEGLLYMLEITRSGEPHYVHVYDLRP